MQHDINDNRADPAPSAVEAAAAKLFKERWAKTTPNEIVEKNEQEHQRLWMEIAAHQNQTVITRGTEQKHIGPLVRARDPEA